MNLLILYVVILGTVKASAQIVRTSFQAIHQAAEGNHGTGLWILASGLVTPAKDAVQEVLCLAVAARAVAKVLQSVTNKAIARFRIDRLAREKLPG
jgi:hypothetical protein